MKELLEGLYYYGQNSMKHDLPFNQWFESNKHLIDSAIEKYLKEQGKEIISSERLEMLENSFVNHPG